MRKLVLGGLAIAAYSAMAVTDFPHGVTMTDCHRTSSAVVASLQTPVQVPPTREMQSSESVATVCMSGTVIQAMDEEDWATSATEIAKSGAQAAFSLLAVGDTPTLKWQGYTGSSWVELTGVTPEEGTYDVKIDFDYSLCYGGGEPKIRYSIKKSDASDYTELSVKDGSADKWIAIGSTAASTSKISNVDLYGFVTTGPVWSQAGARAAEGNINKAADIGISYDTMDLYVFATNTWGVNKVTVALKNEAGDTLATLTQAYVAGTTNSFALSQYIQPGGNYSYDVKLTGTYGGANLSVEADPVRVSLYSTNSWFYFSGTEFVNAQAGNITIANNKFSVANKEQEGTITPTADPAANVGTIVTTTMEISGSTTQLTFYEAGQGPQFAVALGEGSTTGSRVWKYYAGGDWHDATGYTVVSNGVYEGRATFSYANKTVKYEIRSLDEDAFTTLISTSLPATATNLNRVAIFGDGSVSALDATLKLAEPPPVAPPATADAPIVVEKNATVNLAGAEAGDHPVQASPGAHLKWTDASGKIGKMSADGKTLTIKAASAANGMTSFNSYVLGLDAEVATNKPAAVIKPGESQAKGVKVYVPNVNPPMDSGCTPMLQLQSKTGNGDWVNVGNPVGITSEVTIPIGDGKLYRVNTIIK